MEYSFKKNEFTSTDLLQYVCNAYGVQVSGEPFSGVNISSWIRAKKIPDAYGGNRILNVEYIKPLNNLCVLTIEHLNREEIESLMGNLSDYKETLNKKRAVTVVPKNKKPVKQRTELYYKILGSKNMTKKTLKESTLPDNYKVTGIRGNQIKQRKK